MVAVQPGRCARPDEGDASVALVDLDVQFGDSATALGLDPRALDRAAGDDAVDRLDDAQGLPDAPRGIRRVRAVRLGLARGGRRRDRRARRSHRRVARRRLRLRDRRHPGRSRRAHAGGPRAGDRRRVRDEHGRVEHPQHGQGARRPRAASGCCSARRHFVLNRADARVGIEIADVEAALGMPTDAAVPSSRAVPLSMNQGRPIVIDSPSSPAARELVKLADRIEGRDDDGRRGAPAMAEEVTMKLSERLRAQGADAVPRASTSRRRRRPTDRRRATPSASSRSAPTRRCSPASGSGCSTRRSRQEQLHAYVASEIGDLMATTTAPLSADRAPAPRRRHPPRRGRARADRPLPRRPYRQRGHGQRHRTDLRRAQRRHRRDRLPVLLRGPPAPGHRAHRRPGRAAHRRVVADGRRPSRRRLPRQRGDPAALGRRPDADDPQVLARSAAGRRPRRARARSRPPSPISSRPASAAG